MLKVKVNNKNIELNDRTSYYELSLRDDLNGGKRPYLVNANGVIKELRRFVKDGENIEFLYYDNEFVKNAYARTATLILLKAIRDLYGNKAKAGLRFRVKNAYYFEIENQQVDESDIEKIKNRFDEIVRSAEVINKAVYSKNEALKICKDEELEDLRLLFTYNYRPKINMRHIGDYVRYVNGEVLYDTSYVKYYKLMKYNRGFNLLLSDKDDETEVLIEEIGEKSFKTLDISTSWARKLNINTVGKLNQQIARGFFDDLVIMTESFQDKQIGDIAEAVVKSGKKIVFIAGPSSSGKTSFSHRLMYHLRALDKTPHPIASDNFFKNRVDTPKDEKGEYNFEIIEAMDVELLNSTLLGLIEGKEMDMPTFNFVKGVKEFKGDKLSIKENDIIILEGIHCLNPKLVPHIKEDEIFKIYISALTEVSVDNANRIATSDLRLIRRIVRDSRTRGVNAKETIKRWPSVRNGEIMSIFPFQENADIYFNSALIYEFSVLKNKALSKLYDYSEDEEVGAVARRLIKILNYFLGSDFGAIPRHSIIREFIGDSIMEVG